MTIKLLALDMDGTLLNDNKEISAQNRHWIDKARETGVVICLASGRGRQSMLPYHDELDLAGTPFVAVNGGEVWRDEHTLLQRRVLDTDLNAQFVSLAEQTGAWYWAYGPEGYLTKDNWTPGFETESWLKFGFYTDDPVALAHVKGQLNGFGPLAITNSHPNNVEVNPAGVTKASGLAEVCRELGLEMDQVAAMGDSMNDLAMIRESGLGIAMGNAQDTVREAADAVVASNEEDGVAEAIRRFVFGEACG